MSETINESVPEVFTPVESVPIENVVPREDPVVVPSMTKEQIEQMHQIKEGLTIVILVSSFALIITKVAGVW
ncbi:MAG: hypothetical protein WC877_00940 [Dehalococcoidales bacterium]